MTKIMDDVTEYEEGMEVKLVYQKDEQTKKERYMVLAKNEAGHCCTRVDLIQLLDWVKINKPELINRPWVGLTSPEVDEAYKSVSDKEWAIGGLTDARVFFCAIESALREKNK
jgi:hypothetical protein